MDNFYTDSYKRVWGNFRINGDIEITELNNSLTIVDEDDNSHTISLDTGVYHTEYTRNYSELIQELNKQFNNSSLPIEALLGGYHMDEKYNIVVFRMTNDKEIANISGSFYNEVFSN